MSVCRQPSTGNNAVKLRILSLVLLAFCLMVPAFAQDKMAKTTKMAPKMAKSQKATKATKTTKVTKSSKMKDLGNGVFQDSAGKYRDAKGKFMSKKDAEAKLGKKSGPARDPKTGRFMKKSDGKMGKMAPKGAKTPKAAVKKGA